MSACPICEEVIENLSDSIFCKGSNCNDQIHRQCAGLSKNAFDRALESNFTCPKCDLGTVKEEVAAMKKALSTSTPIASVKKFSIIIQGIEECEEGTGKLERQEADLSKVQPILSKLDSSIDFQSIKDLRRLGKYDRDRPRPRPVLVQFLRSADASSILSKAGSVERPYSIQHYMTAAELSRNAVLLKERWAIHTTTGTDLKQIKIRKDSIYVGDQIHGTLNTSTNKYEPILYTQ